MATNRFPDQCGSCGAQVAARAGILGSRQRGRWIVYCDAECAAKAPTVGDAEPAGPTGPPAAEVRVTGTLAQVWAVRDALQLATGLTVVTHSREHPRRDVDDDRVSAYLRVDVTPSVLAAIDHTLGADL